jgi:segregation and condensation protein B
MSKKKKTEVEINPEQAESKALEIAFQLANLNIKDDPDSESNQRFEELARQLSEQASAESHDLLENQHQHDEPHDSGLEALVTGPSPEDQPDTPADRVAEFSSMMVGEPEQIGFEALGVELDPADEDDAEEPKEFVEHERMLSILESLLFSTDKPIGLGLMRQLFKGTNIRKREILRGLELLAADYADGRRGVSLEEVAGGYQLRTKQDNTDFLRRLAKVKPFKLSGPALETLAIVAYKQPIPKAEVDQIRGVESGHLMRSLMERGLVSFAGKGEDLPGKPMLYGTTRKFLETFGLRNIKELPTLAEIDQLLPDGIGADTEEKETLADITDRLSQEVRDGGYTEGEGELVNLSEEIQAINTKSEFFEQEKIRQREERDRERARDLRERLLVGESIDPKDQRWLTRYEVSQAAPAAQDEVAEIAEIEAAPQATDASTT